MKTDKKLIKVVGTYITGTGFSNLKTSVARGIMHLKRGQAPLDFIKSFMSERGFSHYTVNARSPDTWSTTVMALNQDPQVVITYHFVQFLSGDLGFYAKDLTTSELERDMKSLKKIIYEKEVK